jgi:hypothetical protein
MSTSNVNPAGRTAVNGSVSRHVSGISLSGPLVASLVALALAGIAVAVGLATVLSSALAGSIHEGQPREVIEKLIAKSEQQASDYQGRFNGRYIFFKPPPPAPKPPPVDDRPPPPPPPPVEEGPKVPATYQGPSIAWVIGDDVYFNAITATATEKYMRIKVGEERNGVKVINLEKMPRTARVGHLGGEYDVKVFGESTLSASLFPMTPRPSILVPGFIEQGKPVPPVAEASLEPTAPDVAQEESALTGDAGAARRDRVQPNRGHPDERAARAAQRRETKPEETDAEEDGKEQGEGQEEVEEKPDDGRQ